MESLERELIKELQQIRIDFEVLNQTVTGMEGQKESDENELIKLKEVSMKLQAINHRLSRLGNALEKLYSDLL
jgi:hypothetical protein